jgi:hypothetical protein
MQYLCQELYKALYLIQSLCDSVSRNVYFTKFGSILKYGIIFLGGGGGVSDSNAVFKIQKKSLIKGVKNRVSCRNLFSDFEILTVPSLWYIFETLCFIKKNKIFTTQCSDIHKCNTKGKQDLYVQLCNTALCKKKKCN